MAKQDYDLDDFVCCECIEDHALKAHIAAEGTTQTCVLCGRTAKAVTIAELGAILFDVIETFFVQGEYSYDGQEGDSLSWVVQEVMGQYLDCEDCLLRAVRDADPTDPHDGDAPFIELDASYKFRHTSLAEHYAEWRA